MKSRSLASLALGAVVIIGTSGCAAMATQATTIEYSASDGVNVTGGTGPLEIRNAFIVTDAAGSDGNLIAAIVNPTDTDESLRIEYGDGSRTELSVPASTTVSLGTEEAGPLLLVGTDTPAGATMPVYFQSGDGEGALTEVPVLDGELPYYTDLVPGDAPVVYEYED